MFRILCMIGLVVGPGFAGVAIQNGRASEADPLLSTPDWTPPNSFLIESSRGGRCGWPEVQTEARPGAYWWWPGSAVSKQDITWNLETYRRAGWGSMGVIGIYGVRGEESRCIDVFSPTWFAMFNHAVAEADRLGMHIDLTPSSGWRLGGPHVTAKHGEMKFQVDGESIRAVPMAVEVKRAGPGGQGLAINPYSTEAVAFHFDWLDRQLTKNQGRAPRAFYYDSFENSGNWCPELLPAFERRRGYPIQEHAAALAGRGDPDEARRVLCDYRETLSDLLIECVHQIVRWGEERGSGLRMQAHGAPANLLDMYAAAAIPETEVFGASQFEIPGFRRDPQWVRPDRHCAMINRFAASAAHVAGRPLVISESFTWLRNHYHTALAHIKAEADNLLLNGINGIFYHGTCFAPQETAWPGWLFYASIQANARNSIFRDIPALNAYITRCQSVLQAGLPCNDLILYWPVYDLWMAPGTRELRFTVHHPEWLEETSCGEAGQWLMDHGHTFDFVSDRQILATTCDQGAIRTQGRTEYRAILVPDAKYMKVATVRKLLDLARAGATVLVWRGLPEDVPGWREAADRKRELNKLLADVAEGPFDTTELGHGKWIVGDDLEALVEAAGIDRERVVDHGLKFIRRRHPTHVTYFLANPTSTGIDTWVPLAVACRAAVLMDPMTGRTGVIPVRNTTSQPEIRLQLDPGETRILRAFATDEVTGPAWQFVNRVAPPIPVTGTWRIEFIEGGPVLPNPLATTQLKCWTELGGADVQRFAGAARYTVTIERPAVPADGWYLELGDVRESARVWIHGQPVGVAIAHPFRVDLGNRLRAGSNEIRIEVTNLSANRIRDLDRRGIAWKKFYDINLVDQNYKPFDASNWDLKPSGLLGPVTIVPYTHIQ